MQRIDNDLIKALRCLASQDENGDCYMEHYNSMHLSGDVPLIACESNPVDGRITCPYHQKKYETCFPDGGCGEWLRFVANELEAHLGETDKENPVSQVPEAADIEQAIEYFKDELSRMNIFSDMISFSEVEWKSIETALMILQKAREELEVTEGV